MLTYNVAKSELVKRGEKTTYFTKKFFQDYFKARERFSSIINSLDAYTNDRYIMNGITLFHSYDKIYHSKFYNKNSCAYCVFLEIVQEYKEGR